MTAMPIHIYLDPYGGQIAVSEAARNIVAMVDWYYRPSQLWRTPVIRKLPGTGSTNQGIAQRVNGRYTGDFRERFDVQRNGWSPIYPRR